MTHFEKIRNFTVGEREATEFLATCSDGYQETLRCVCIDDETEEQMMQRCADWLEQTRLEAGLTLEAYAPTAP
jgi:hypothetical protein